jgi:hypothetical protein
MIHYSIYGDSSNTILSHAALCECNKATGDFLARAENSGCEGCHVEVARWSHTRGRWERFCFVKFLGGEDDSRPELNSVQLAERHAAEVNESAAPGQFLLPLIHKLPSAPAAESVEFVNRPLDIQ